MPQSLVIVHVQVHVKPEAVEAFRAATLDNAPASVKEPGIARFDVDPVERGSDALRAGRGLPHARRARPRTRRRRTTRAGATPSPS